MPHWHQGAGANRGAWVWGSCQLSQPHTPPLGTQSGALCADCNLGERPVQSKAQKLCISGSLGTTGCTVSPGGWLGRIAHPTTPRGSCPTGAPQLAQQAGSQTKCKGFICHLEYEQRMQTFKLHHSCSQQARNKFINDFNRFVMFASAV